jgi:hypothetical protein
MLRDDLRLLIIELGQLTSGSSLDSQQFVELRVNGLRVPMLRPLAHASPHSGSMISD